LPGKSIAHKKGRCKRSGQSKTWIKEQKINVSEHGAMSRKKYVSNHLDSVANGVVYHPHRFVLSGRLP
jgi:hypothetical protein